MTYSRSPFGTTPYSAEDSAAQALFDITLAATGQSALGAETVEERFDINVQAIASSAIGAGILAETFDLSLAAVAQSALGSETVEERFDLNVQALASGALGDGAMEALAPPCDLAVDAVASSGTSASEMEWEENPPLPLLSSGFDFIERPFFFIPTRKKHDVGIVAVASRAMAQISVESIAPVAAGVVAVASRGKAFALVENISQTRIHAVAQSAWASSAWESEESEEDILFGALALMEN